MFACLLEFHGKAAHDIFNKICLSVPSCFEGQFSSIGEFLMGFSKMCFECDPYFLDCRETIPGFDLLLEFPCLVKNSVCLGYHMMV